MNVKKLISFIALISFSWSVLFAQTYEDSARITEEAETLQNDGEYQKSYDKSQEAADSIDKTTTDLFYRLMNLRINKAKNDAEKSINEINQLGASKDNQFKARYEEAVRYFNEGNNSIGSLPSPTDTAENEEEFIIASNDFNTVYLSYSNALASANSVKEGYLMRERATATKTIADAKAKYNAALNAKTLTAGDANGKAIASSLSKADEALKNDNFASVQQNVAAALSALSRAESAAKAKAEAEAKARAAAAAKAKAEAEAKAKAAAKAKADAVAKAKSDIANAQKKYNALIGDKTIVKGDNNDKSVSALLNEANRVVQNDPKTASERALTASKNMDKIVSDRAASIEREEDLRNLEELKTRHEKLINEGYLIKDSEDDKNLSKLISEAEDALNKNNNALAREKMQQANQSLNAIQERGPQRTGDGDVVIGETGNNETGQIIDGEENNQNQNIQRQPVNTEGKITVLPQYYVVVRRVPLTDALWRIAGYSYIYNNPIQWYRIYEANRNILRDPDNPDLILPGQRLTIPSLNGEQRSGQYDPQSNYITYEEAMQLMSEQTSTNE